MILSCKYPAAKRGKIVLWGLMASFPFGGMTWQVLHHLVGLRRLGFDVWYVEDSDRPVLSPDTFWSTLEYAPNITYLSRWMDSVGLGNRWIFRSPKDRDSCLGATDLAGLMRLYEETDAVFNLCGAHYLRPEHSVIRCLVYLQTDPVGVQVLVAQGNSWLTQQLDAYHYLFTYGENLGEHDCLIPVESHQWHPTRAPVYIDWWDNAGPAPSGAKLTTVANWKNLGKDIVWQGVTYYWRKDYEFQRFKTLPLRSALSLELALEGINEEEAIEMRSYGWDIVSARELSDPAAYRDYIRTSLGEFTVAKDQNIRLRSGWFSDRSACYLAAGRPVITQDTGFGNNLPTGEGLFSFSSEDEALAAIDALAQNYTRQSDAAREIAHEFFGAERVLENILRQIGLL